MARDLEMGDQVMEDTCCRTSVFVTMCSIRAVIRMSEESVQADDSIEKMKPLDWFL